MSNLSDSEIEQWVLKEIGLAANGSREICVHSHNGVVTLQGTVKSLDHKLAVSRAAQIASGVICVNDDIRVNLPAKSNWSDVKNISSLRQRSRIPSHRLANLQSALRRNA